jgi:nucleoside-diphosphate-sugar epimerase
LIAGADPVIRWRQLLEALVLGGSRFIGLHLVRLLSSQGHRVTVLNRGQTEAELPDDVERLTADRTEPEQVRDALFDRS